MWNSRDYSYRSPDEDAMVGYDEIRWRREHPILAKLLSRPALMLFSSLLPVIGYLILTNVYKDILDMPQRVATINVGLRTALGNTIALQGDLRDVDSALTGIKHDVSDTKNTLSDFGTGLASTNSQIASTNTNLSRRFDELENSFQDNQIASLDAMSQHHAEFLSLYARSAGLRADHRVQYASRSFSDLGEDTSLAPGQVSGDWSIPGTGNWRRLLILFETEQGHHLVPALWIERPGNTRARVSTDIARSIGLARGRPKSITLLLP